MSSLNHSGEESSECPLCMEPLEMDDLSFYPCTCGYQVIFCIFTQYSEKLNFPRNNLEWALELANELVFYKTEIEHT